MLAVEKLALEIVAYKSYIFIILILIIEYY